MEKADQGHLEAKGGMVQNLQQCTGDFFQLFCLCFETSSVHFSSRKRDILQATIDDLASKVIKYGKESKEKDKFDHFSWVLFCYLTWNRSHIYH